MLEKELLERILDKALEKGGDFAEVYVEEKLTSNVLCEGDQIEKINSGREKGAGIRVLRGGQTSYVFTNDLSAAGLLKAAAVVNHGSGKGDAVPVVPTMSEPKTSRRMEFLRWPDQVDYAEKIERILKANNIARNLDEEIRQVTVAVGDLHKKVQIANSYGELIEDESARVRLTVNTVAARDGQIQTGLETAGGVCGWELLEQVSLDDMAEQASRRALNMLSARPAPAGQMPVVIHGSAGGTMVHEACGHGLEADLVQKGLSVYQEQLGQLVAAPEVSVVDDATLPGKYGSYHWDDEGSPAQRTLLIDKGELRSFLYDRLTAAQDKLPSTGNGRRESYQEKPIPRMSNTFIASGSDDPEQIIRDTVAGLLVKKMGGGQVNTTNGDFVFEVQEGYIIENGEIKYPVRGATLIGNGPRVLVDIDRVGQDLGFAIGICGKDGQGVPVGDAQPTIRIKKLTVGGTFAASGPHIKKISRR